MLLGEFVAGVLLLIAPAPPRPSEPPPTAPQSADLRSVELINLGGDTAAALLTRIAANTDAAVAAVEAFWGTDWSRRITVTATGSDRQFAALAGGVVGAGTARWSDVAAVAVADRVDVEQRSVTGQQIVFAPGAAAMSTPALRLVLTHELFHYAARVDTAAGAPRWLTEGVADFVARPGSVPPGTAAVLPSDADLDAPGPRRAQAYDRAWAFTRFVADRYGTAALRELYLSACGPGRVALPVALHRVLDADPPEVIAGWRRWLASAG